jgi:hypothetical protein
MAENEKSKSKKIEKSKPGKKKGSVKTGGRKKGVPNKASQKTSLLEYAREIGKAPAELMLEVANGLQPIEGYTFTASEMLQAAKDVAPYCHPKLRSTEIKGEMIPATLIIKSS